MEVFVRVAELAVSARPRADGFAGGDRDQRDPGCGKARRRCAAATDHGKVALTDDGAAYLERASACWRNSRTWKTCSP